MGAWQVEEDSLTLSEPCVRPRGCERGSAADHTLERSLLLRAVTASMVVNLSVLPFFHLEMASKVHLQQFLPLKWEEMGS